MDASTSYFTFYEFHIISYCNFKLIELWSYTDENLQEFNNSRTHEGFTFKCI